MSRYILDEGKLIRYREALEEWCRGTGKEYLKVVKASMACREINAGKLIDAVERVINLADYPYQTNDVRISQDIFDELVSAMQEVRKAVKDEI